MTKILFVCHGNICRSPMAEFIMKKLVADKGLENEFLISSCATSMEEIWNGVGNPIYPPAKDELKRRGIPFDENKRAVRLRPDDYEKYDLIIAMDSLNIRNIMHIIGADDKEKVHKLMEYTNKNRDVSDPWYSGRFSKAFDDIYKGCAALLEKLTLNETAE